MTDSQRISKLTAENRSLRIGRIRDRHCLWLLVRQLGGAAQISAEDIRETADSHHLEGEWITPEVMELKASNKPAPDNGNVVLPNTR